MPKQENLYIYLILKIFFNIASDKNIFKYQNIFLSSYFFLIKIRKKYDMPFLKKHLAPVVAASPGHEKKYYLCHNPC